MATIGESRIESIEGLTAAGVGVPMLLIRSPMLSQVERVVAHAAISCKSELSVLQALSAAAQRQGLCHGVLLMVELGDLRKESWLTISKRWRNRPWPCPICS